MRSRSSRASARCPTVVSFALPELRATEISRNRQYVAVAALCACFPLIALSADRLNVKVGLWEITSKTAISGVPPIPKELKDTMTPEQRARMEADFKAETAKGPIERTDRECITKEDLDHPFSSSNTENCTQNIVQASATAQEIRLVCTGNQKGTGSFRVTTPTAESMTGDLDLKLGEGKEVMTVKSQLRGRWIGADCGDEADEDEKEER
jgi:hypothetical protein